MKRARICLVTPAHLSYNPRLLKEADALHEAGYQVRVVAMGLDAVKAAWDARLMANRRWTLETFNACRDNFVGRINWLYGALRQRVLSQSSRLEQLPGGLERTYNRHFPEMCRLAAAERADLFIAHNLPALPVAAFAARRWKSRLGFDAEDFHRGEIGGNSSGEIAQRRLVEAVEAKYIPQCQHLTAASGGIGDAYAKALGLRKPATILNVFPLSERSGHTPADELRRERCGEGMSLYWYSQVIGSDRGLDDALLAVARLGSRVRLHLRGAWAQGYEQTFLTRCRELGINDRVHILPPAPPEQLVERAAQHDVGLALELGHTQNRRVAVTNKILNYFLAGLAIAATDVPGQRGIMETTSGAGFLFRPGDVTTLSNQLQTWRNHPEALQAAKALSAQLGEMRFCWDREKERFLRVVGESLRN